MPALHMIDYEKDLMVLVGDRHYLCLNQHVKYEFVRKMLISIHATITVVETVKRLYDEGYLSTDTECCRFIGFYWEQREAGVNVNELIDMLTKQVITAERVPAIEEPHEPRTVPICK